MKRAPKKPGDDYIKFYNYWIRMGTQDPEDRQRFILTTTVKKRLKSLARIVVARKYPVLIQVTQQLLEKCFVKYSFVYFFFI